MRAIDVIGSVKVNPFAQSFFGGPAKSSSWDRPHGGLLQEDSFDGGSPAWRAPTGTRKKRPRKGPFSIALLVERYRSYVTLR